jgi:dolichol kinase
LAGSLAFFFTSLAIMFWYVSFSGSEPTAVTMLWLPVVATIAESLSGEGTDNLVVPLLVALVLTSSLA